MIKRGQVSPLLSILEPSDRREGVKGWGGEGYVSRAVPCFGVIGPPSLSSCHPHPPSPPATPTLPLLLSPSTLPLLLSPFTLPLLLSPPNLPLLLSPFTLPLLLSPFTLPLLLSPFTLPLLLSPPTLPLLLSPFTLPLLLSPFTLPLLLSPFTLPLLPPPPPSRHPLPSCCLPEFPRRGSWSWFCYVLTCYADITPPSPISPSPSD